MRGSKRSEEEVLSSAGAGAVDNTDQHQASPSQNTSIRLLLHCSDGVVPFLTPSLLETCFPPKQVQNVLMLGLAAKDTCVVPVYVDSKKKDETKTNTKMNSSVVAAAKDTNTNSSKPRGYTFSSAVRVDPWLLDYTRVTVPTFCLLQDALDRNSNKDGKKGSKNNSNISSSVTVTSQHALLWTANGRTPLTPAVYYDAATAGLQSHFSVPLFDNTDDGTTAAKSASAKQKRTRAAIQRTQDFLADFLFRQTQRQIQQADAPATTTTPDSDTCTTKAPSAATDRQSLVWAPYLVTDDDLESNDAKGKDGDMHTSQAHQQQPQQQMDTILQKVQIGAVTGVVLIGWQHLESSNKRKAVLHSVLQSVQGASPPQQHGVVTVGLLSTNTLQQVLEAACAGVHVIGSRLPTVWAQAKKAFCCGTGGTPILLDSGKDALVDRKRRRLNNDDDDDDKGNNNSNSKMSNDRVELDADGCVNLEPDTNDPTLHPWFHDKRSIQAGCSCLTCRTHSRSYIYHLVCAKELVAEILLFVHNLHAVLELLREFQSAHEKGEALELYEYLQEQLN